MSANTPKEATSAGEPLASDSPRAMADLVVDAASDKKAEDILVLNVSEVTTIADLFVIVSGRGERQVQAIADEIVDRKSTRLNSSHG